MTLKTSLTRENSSPSECARCGLCLGVCPTYRELPREPFSPRGRLTLAAALLESQTATPGLLRYLGSCLDCLACAAACPSGVPTAEILDRAREKLRSCFPLPFYHRFWLHHLLPWPGRQIWLFSWRRPARLRLPSVLQPRGKRRYSVHFFLGCVNNVWFPEVALASLSLLQEVGCEVIIPPVRCCGKPLVFYGELEKARELARYNLDLLYEAEQVVTDCATCGSFLKSYPRLLESRRAGDFALKVKDIGVFLLEAGLIPGGVGERVTYHIPCHLGRGQGAGAAVTELLRRAGEFVPLPEAEVCCGGAGSYRWSYPELSRKILKRKVENIRRTGASLVVTSCPACLLQLRRGLKGTGIRVSHLSLVLRGRLQPLK